MTHPRWFLTLLCLVLLAGPLAAEQPEQRSTVVFLVRHAEKAAEPKEDPPLSERGRERAARLAELLGEAGVTALYATEWRRTQDTLKPLAERLQRSVRVLPAKDDAAFARAIRAERGGVVVVAGHSNTLGPILEALGAAPIAEIADTDYDNLFMATLTPAGEVRVVRLRWSP